MKITKEMIEAGARAMNGILGLSREEAAQFVLTAALRHAEPVAVGLTADQLCRTPLIEWLVPTTEEWNACEVMQDRYNLMKKRVRLAFTDAALIPKQEG